VLKWLYQQRQHLRYALRWDQGATDVQINSGEGGNFPDICQNTGNIWHAVNMLNIIWQVAAAMQPFTVSTASTFY